MPLIASALPQSYPRYSHIVGLFPDFDACGLFRAAHSHNPTTYEQTHVGLDLFTLASLSYRLQVIRCRHDPFKQRLRKGQYFCLQSMLCKPVLRAHIDSAEEHRAAMPLPSKG